jgi:hypothetical protein
MSDEVSPDLSLLAGRQRQILTGTGSVRDDLAALTTIAMRQDGYLAGLRAEVRAMRSQHSRLAN